MDPLVQAAITRFALQVTAVEPVANSYSSTVRILTLSSGNKVVLKIPFSKSKVVREVRMLLHLRGRLPVPELLDYYLAEDGVGALLLSYLPGSSLNAALSDQAAFALGQLLAQLHSVPMTLFGDEFENPSASAKGWWELMDEFFYQWVPLCERVLEPELIRASDHKYQQLRADLPAPDGPCAVHFDYRPANVLWQDDTLIGLIDFESARGGSADRDFIKIKDELWELTPQTEAPFLAGYQSVRPLPDLERTLPFYTLHLAFGGVGWCVRRGKLDDPFMQRNLEALRQVLS